MKNPEYYDLVKSVKNGLVISIDGEKHKTALSYLTEIWKKLKFPGMHINWDAYLDWMRDLEWLEENEIVIIIHNFDAFLSENQEKKKYFLYDFENIILPYWDKDAIGVLENEDKIKKITLRIEN